MVPTKSKFYLGTTKTLYYHNKVFRNIKNFVKYLFRGVEEMQIINWF